MRVLTAEGQLRDVSTRSSPLAGLGSNRSYSPASTSINLLGTLDQADYVSLYKSNPWINAAVRSISWGISRMVLCTFELQADGQRERIRWDLPAGSGRPPSGIRLDKLLNGPSPTGWGRQRRLRRTMVDYLIMGNALWYVQPEGIYYTPWRKITVHEDRNDEIMAFEVTSNGGGRRFLMPEDCIHFCAGDDPDSNIGVSPMSSLRATLQLHEALQRHLVRFFENSARPSGNLKLDSSGGNPSDALMNHIREQVSELYASPENAGRILVTTGDFQPITAAADQSQIIELAKQSRDEIAGVYRIPGPVLGSMEHAIKSNVKELREQYIRDVIGGWAPAVEDDIMAQLVHPSPSWRGLFTEFDHDEHLRPDLEGLGQAFIALERTMSTNERRRKLNLPDLPYPEADTVPSVPGGGYLGIEVEIPPQLDPNAPLGPDGKPLPPEPKGDDLLDDDESL